MLVISKKDGELWKINETEIEIEGKKVRTFGISANAVEIKDLSIHRGEVEKFIELLNRLEASEIHAYDLAEDFLLR